MGSPAEKQTAPKTAISPRRDEDFSGWYHEVIRAAQMAENAPVRGCMTIKPYGYRIWELIQAQLDSMIKDEGVENAYFPLLIPVSYLAKEAEHIEGFAPECAVVTHHRLEKGEDGQLVPAAPLSEPLIVRPTSETIIGEAYANWIQSYRDLPLKINQWGNVMRWELRTRLFLRTSEFLWQEGHNVFETEEQADADARRILEVYASLYEDYFAMPVMRGEKTADERFPGAIHSYTVETMMQDGKALQSCTSHNLGQTFSRSAEIKFQNREGQEVYAWTTSWGLSTRSIGGMIMTHGDDDGLICPPRLAPHQVVILPIPKKGEEDSAVMDFADKVEREIKNASVRVLVDRSDDRAPDKMWRWIKKGAPIRMEVGPREAEEGVVTAVRRDLGKASKQSVSLENLAQWVQEQLDEMHGNLYQIARKRLEGNTFEANDCAGIAEYYREGGTGFIRAPVAVLDDPQFQDLKKEYAITPRCMPFEDEGRKVVIGKSY